MAYIEDIRSERAFCVSTPIVKICGISTRKTLQGALAAGADMIGLVHFPPSPRHIHLNLAADLRAQIADNGESVVLLVDPDDELIDQVVEAVRPDWIQLHGNEPPARVAEVKSRARCRVIKALGIRHQEDVASVTRYAETADLFILDAKPPKGATRPGGLGEPFDWNLLETLPTDLPFLLAGGVTAETVGRALRATRACGVDASSSLETAAGRKDVDLITSFIRQAKAAWTDGDAPSARHNV